MTEQVNPNTEVKEESNAESKIGEVTSFEQLDRITDQQITEEKQAKRMERKQKAEAKAQAEAEAAQDAGENDGGEELPKQHDTEADKNIDATLGINPEDLKPIKLSHGEETYELLPTAEVPVKVDGEKGSVPLQELINNYSGKTAWDKRFNELNQERQQYKIEKRQFDQEKAFVEEKVGKFYELSQEDPIKAFDFLCEISGKDPVEFQKKFRDNLVQKFEEYYNMDELARREFDLAERERYLEAKRQKEAERARLAETQKHEQQQIQSTLDKFGLDEGTYLDLKDELAKSSPDTRFEPMHVIRYQRALLAQKVVKEVRPDKAEDPKVLGELATVLVQNPEFKEDDVKSILREVWKDEPSQASKTLSKKVLKTQTQAKTSQQAKKALDDEPWSFDHV